MSECERQCEYKLAFHCAPSLCGIKCANLYSMKKSDFSPEYFAYASRFLSVKKMKIKILCKKGNRYLVFVYNTEMLKKRLKDPKRQEILAAAGYEKCKTVDECISYLAKRINKSAEFPHETGIFLDYPPEDVKGFIENGGNNFKLCGFWKVYSDTETAGHLFVSYRRCRDWLCTKIKNGANLSEILC